MSRQLYSVLFCLALSSCAVGPNYEEPEAPKATEFVNHRQHDRVQAEMLWWKTFQDKELNQLIEKAVLKNKDVAQALARINESRSLANAAIGDLFPGLQLSTSYEKAEATGARFPDGSIPKYRYEVYNAGLDASWEIDIFGGLRRELEARNAEYSASVADLQDVILMTISEVGSSYFQLRGAQEQLRIAKKNRRLQKKTFRLVQTKYEFGEVGALDVEQARTQLAQTEARLPTLRTIVKTQAHRIAVLLGEKPEALYTSLLSTPGKFPVYKGPAQIGNPAEMMRRRPDIRRAERAVAASNARIGTAMAELFPKVSLNGFLGMEAPRFGDLNRDTSTFRVTPEISWKILSFGQLQYQLRAARYKEKQALLAYEQSVLKAFEDVENALVRYSNERRRALRLRAAVESSQKAYSIAHLQYEEGMLDLLDLIITQQSMLKSETDAVEAQQNVMLALISVYKAFGGGWEAWEVRDHEEIIPDEKIRKSS